MSEKLKNIIATGEGYYIEFKRSFDKSVIEEVCAFANSSGGKIFLGVDDNRVIRGVDTGNKMRSKIQDTLKAA